MSDLDSKRLTELLRAGDPAADGGQPDPHTVARLRRRLRGEAVGVGGSARIRRPLLVLAASVALTLVLGWQLTRSDRFDLLPPQATPESSGEQLSPRQLQFTTPGGTRVIWTLDPDFEI